MRVVYGPPIDPGSLKSTPANRYQLTEQIVAAIAQVAGRLPGEIRLSTAQVKSG